MNVLHIPFSTTSTTLPDLADASRLKNWGGGIFTSDGSIIENWGLSAKPPRGNRSRIRAIVSFDKQWQPIASILSDADVSGSNSSTWLQLFEKAVDASLVNAGRGDLWKFMAPAKFAFFDAVTGGFIRTQAWSRYVALAWIIAYVTAIFALSR
jgi:hypothetical protein